MKKLISYCLYGSTPMYLDGAIENTIYAKKVYPEWTTRIYCHQNVPDKYIMQLINNGAEVFVINDNKANININWVKLWRFYPCSEKGIDYIIFRDTDSRLSYREKAAVDKWIESGTNFNILHDNDAHCAIMLAGMWGCKGSVIDNIYKLIDDYLRVHLNNDPSKCLWNSDQIFLEKYIWVLAKNSHMAFGTNPKIKEKYPQLITNEYPTNKGFLTQKESFIGQKIYKKLFDSSPINIYHIEHNMPKKSWICQRLLGHIKLIGSTNVVSVDTINKAYIIIGSYESAIKNFIDENKNKYDLTKKIFLVWCLEPKWSTAGTPIMDYNEFKIHIMNCYTGDVYVSPFQFCQTFTYKHFDISKMDSQKYNNTKTKIVVIATAKNNDASANVSIPGKNLIVLRYKTSMDMYNIDKNSIHIYGQGWPDNIAKKYTGVETHVYKEKLDILKNYYFNICFENTCQPGYITEKIWHSIIGGCLPIYYGNQSIYTVFPHNSFIDSTKFKTSRDLLNFIQNMNYNEFYKRFQLCYNVVKNIKPVDISNCDVLIRKKLLEKFNYLRAS